MNKSRPSKNQYLPLSQDLPLGYASDKEKRAGWLTLEWTFPSLSPIGIACCVLLASNLLWIFLYFDVHHVERLPPDYARVNSLPTRFLPFNWWTEYSEKNATAVDELWDDILPSHGFVAMDTEWAMERNWPESMRLPSDASKSVYLLEAYHQLHCIKIIRKTFWELYNGNSVTFPISHSGHCFDMIRQTIYCNADNTPLYLFGDDTAGDGQLHKCRDWNALRDFATQHTACYRDSEKPIVLGDHFGYCDDGSDGVMDAKRANVTVERVEVLSHSMK